MTKKLTGLQQLLVEQLQELYDAEKQLTRALPQVAIAVNDEELVEAIREHFETTKGHVERLEQAFESLGLKAKSKPSAGMEGILLEGSETIQEKSGELAAVLDVAVSSGLRRVGHFEIAGYTAASDLARELGHHDVAGLLDKTLHEENAAEEKLGELSKRILKEAAAAERENGDGDGGARRTRTAR